MTEMVAGMVIGAVIGSLVTAAYLGLCLKVEQENKRSWIDRAIARAFVAVDRSPFEVHPTR